MLFGCGFKHFVLVDIRFFFLNFISIYCFWIISDHGLIELFWIELIDWFFITFYYHLLPFFLTVSLCRNFSCTETLCSEQKYFCETCGSKQEAQKRFIIILIVFCNIIFKKFMKYFFLPSLVFCNFSLTTFKIRMTRFSLLMVSI